MSGSAHAEQPMRFVVASAAPERVDALRACSQAAQFEVRSGSVPETSAGCDVALVSFPLAADRYGALWLNHAAQVLSNDRHDGAPLIIVALPTVPERRSAAEMGEDGWAQWTITGALEALSSTFGPDDDLTVLVHLEATALDREPSSVMTALDRISRAAEREPAVPPHTAQEVPPVAAP